MCKNNLKKPSETTREWGAIVLFDPMLFSINSDPLQRKHSVAWRKALSVEKQWVFVQQKRVGKTRNWPLNKTRRTVFVTCKQW